MKDSNLATYKATGIVNYYAKLSRLQPAERTILKHFQSRWGEMKMLDIGIGGGRTTRYFAPLVKEYVGIDYSAEMIAACKQKLENTLANVSLKVTDARDLSQFESNYFDFILFSFNGIDYACHSDRLKIFQEVARVGKSGGYFGFSSHNLQAMAKEFVLSQKLSFNLFKTYVDLIMFVIGKIFNPHITPDKINNATHLIIRDESHNFRLQTYYIRPQAQIAQLKPNFKNVKVYSWQSGREIKNMDDTAIDLDMWLYYLGTIL